MLIRSGSFIAALVDFPSEASNSREGPGEENNSRGGEAGEGV